MSNQIALVQKFLSCEQLSYEWHIKNHGIQLRVRETESTAREKPTVNQGEECEVHKMGIFLYVQNAVSLKYFKCYSLGQDGRKTLPVELW